MKRQNLKIYKNKKKQAGITLVALVITVVVMLILAGVAIAAVVDGDGLFSKTRQAAETYENAARNEGDTIQSMINQIDEYLERNDYNIVVYDKNQTYDGKKVGSYNNPIIPKGFAPINEGEATWGSSDGYQKGLVIQDESGNQFVWVPVDGTNVTFERYDFGTGSKTFEMYSEVMPIEVSNSINNNGGFYIARYEAGIAINMPQEELSADSTATYGDGIYKPVSKQGAIVWNYIQWGENNEETAPERGAVTVARSMYPENDTNYGAVSTLIYGTQWDTALNFIGAYDVGEAGYDTYAIDSTGMGNYSGTNGADDIESYRNSESDTSGPSVAGAREGFKQKNIYDMAGNLKEWTMEICDTHRVSRGGFFGDLYPASRRSNNSVDNNYDGKRFPRSALYKVT